MVIGRSGTRSRKRLGLIGLAGVAILASVLFFGIQMAMADGSPPASPKNGAPKATQTSLKTSAIGGSTIFSTGSNGSTSAGTFAPLDGVGQMKCPKNCTIYIEGTVTAYDGGTGNIALCYDVDGSFGSCAYLGPLSPGGFSERTYQETFSGLGKGTHTVQTYEETDNAATLGYWTIKYDIYRNT